MNMERTIEKSNNFITNKAIAVKAATTNNRGEGYIDTAVKILIAVVLGALLLAGLYLLFGDVVMPTLTERIKEMFNYAG
jgi:putative flippase GtrA